eukprot:8428898-Pyramimonas_sp.AAC.1
MLGDPGLRRRQRLSKEAPPKTVSETRSKSSLRSLSSGVPRSPATHTRGAHAPIARPSSGRNFRTHWLFHKGR